MANHREDIIKYMARTFFVCAYADHCDQCEEDACEVCGEVGGAGPGEDWFNVAPAEIPQEATEIAAKVAEKFERDNGRTLDAAHREAAALPGRHLRDPSLEEFAFCLAMEAMGHGVSWADNHPAHGFKVAYVEGMYL